VLGFHDVERTGLRIGGRSLGNKRCGAGSHKELRRVVTPGHGVGRRVERANHPLRTVEKVHHDHVAGGRIVAYPFPNEGKVGPRRRQGRSHLANTGIGDRKGGTTVGANREEIADTGFARRDEYRERLLARRQAILDGRHGHSAAGHKSQQRDGESAWNRKHESTKA